MIPGRGASVSAIRPVAGASSSASTICSELSVAARRAGLSLLALLRFEYRASESSNRSTTKAVSAASSDPAMTTSTAAIAAGRLEGRMSKNVSRCTTANYTTTFACCGALPPGCNSIWHMREMNRHSRFDSSQEHQCLRCFPSQRGALPKGQSSRTCDYTTFVRQGPAA